MTGPAPPDLATRLQGAVDSDPARADLSGVIRISQGGQLLFEQAHGNASVQLGVVNTPATRFHIASVTKMFISALVMRLAEDGVLALGEHPSLRLPVLAGLDPRITLHHLLTHTAGLADIYDQPELRIDMTRLAARKGRLLDYLAALPATGEPGAGWRYSTTGFLLLAYVAQAAAGEPFDALVRARLLDPLDLADTGPDDPVAVNPGRAFGHSGEGGVWRHTPNDGLAEADGPREFFSTAADLDRWLTAILDGRALNEASARLTFTPHAAVGENSGFGPGLLYGYGWFLGPGFRWIGGLTAGFRAQLWQFPAERLNVVMLWNNERVNSQRLFARLRPILLG
jgi:CubicO group peptidase (beta-lactamase class C family)